MEQSILKNLNEIVLGSLLLFFIGCESPHEPVDDNHGTIYVTVEYIPEIDLGSNWQTLYTMWGVAESNDMDITYTRVEWESDMFWHITDNSGYFRLDCRECEEGTWYDEDGTTSRDTFSEHVYVPVTNQVSLVREDGEFNNVLAPVQSMVGQHMWLWWSISSTVIDSQRIQIR